MNSVVPYYVNGWLPGIGRTTKELVDALNRKQDLPIEVVLYSQNMKGIGGRNMGTHFKTRHCWLPNRERTNRTITKIPLFDSRGRYDLLHIPHNFAYVKHPEKTVITMHDAMFFAYPEEFLGHAFAREHYPGLAKKCRGIITCSESSKRDIVKYMDINEEKIFVCPWGIRRDVFHPIENCEKPERPFFMMVSCDIGRKNTISVLKAYELFAKQEPQHTLKLVWKNPSKEIREYCEKPSLKGRIEFVSGISDEMLNRLYNQATATFYPSKYEGFGLPVAESMACGTPVITCRNSSLAEVGGDAAIYVEPEDCEAMAKEMEQFENGEYEYAALREKCLTQGNKFSWDKCAEETLAVYERLL